MECIWKTCCSRWSSWAHPAWQGWDGLWADQQCCGTGRATETLALDWTSAARAMEAVEQTSRSPGTPQSCAAGTGVSAGGRTLKTALRTFPDCSPPYQTCFTPQHHGHLVIVLTHMSKWLIFILHSSWGLSLWTGSRTRKGLIHSHWCSVLNPHHKPNKTSDKKLDRPTYGNIYSSRIWKHKIKCHPPSRKCHIPHMELLKPVLFWHSSC